MELSDERHDDLLRRDDVVLLVVDMQEKLLQRIHDHERIQRRLNVLVQGALALGVPLLYTEHYPTGLGPTEPKLKQLLNGVTCVEKETFSCVREPKLLKVLRDSERTQVVVAGIETHICILQTALDLVAEGFSVHCPTDAVGSRVAESKQVGLRRMEKHGVTVTTTESVLFELMERANTDAFRSVLPLLREPE